MQITFDKNEKYQTLSIDYSKNMVLVPTDIVSRAVVRLFRVQKETNDVIEILLNVFNNKGIRCRIYHHSTDEQGRISNSMEDTDTPDDLKHILAKLSTRKGLWQSPLLTDEEHHFLESLPKLKPMIPEYNGENFIVAYCESAYYVNLCGWISIDEESLLNNEFPSHIKEEIDFYLNAFEK